MGGMLFGCGEKRLRAFNIWHQHHQHHHRQQGMCCFHPQQQRPLLCPRLVIGQSSRDGPALPFPEPALLSKLPSLASFAHPSRAVLPGFLPSQCMHLSVLSPPWLPYPAQPTLTPFLCSAHSRAHSHALPLNPQLTGSPSPRPLPPIPCPALPRSFPLPSPHSQDHAQAPHVHCVTVPVVMQHLWRLQGALGEGSHGVWWV